jgi:hypothetical protein
MNRIPLFLLAFLLTGCATQASLTVYSQPEGAYITEIGTGRVYGVAPLTVAYDAAPLFATKQPDGCFRVLGFEVRWVSGAKATLETVAICGSATGTYNITFSRPADFPDIEKDLQFALQVQTVRAQQQQAQAAQDAAAAAILRTFAPPSATPVRCTSRQVGSTVQTTCN